MNVPPEYDVHVITYLGRFLGRHPLFDLVVQSGIDHHVLGGLWYAAALFFFWVKGARGNGRLRPRVLTIFAGLGIAITLAIIAAKLISWPPPTQRGPSAIFPDYLAGNLNPNSFPSFSTAVYTAVALGVYTLHRLTGALLLAGIPVLIALPRVYVGGHYPTDVLAGFVLAAIGFIAARTLLEHSVIRRLEPVFNRGGWSRVAGEVLVFVAIWQIAVEFSEVIWLKRAIPVLLR